MGIDVRIETETGKSLSGVGDPHCYLSWGLSLYPLDSTACLRFIDPYGNATFNHLQLPALFAELQEVQNALTNCSLEAAKKDYIERAASWHDAAIKDAAAKTTSFSLDDIRRHFGCLIALVQDAIKRGNHHYVKFIGD